MLRSRISDGEYRPGYNLPPQRALAEEFEVSRDTIQRVLNELKTEGWIESRQGSGSRVRATLPIHVATQPKVSPGRTARAQAEAIRDGQIRAPERIALRLLLPSDTTELPYPRARAAHQSAPI